MPILFLLSLFMTIVWGKPSVMISYFDAFNGASFNNSGRVANELARRLNTTESPLTIKLCPLPTVFDKAYGQLENCQKALADKPVMVISLGESTCELKLETIVINNDKSHGPDNEGVNRNNTRIISDAPSLLGLHYPLPQMYCGLSPKERKSVEISKNAGSFVCNNTGFQMSYYYPEILYGFVHVPAHNCLFLRKKTEVAITQLEKMIQKGVTYLLGKEEHEKLPHILNAVRLPTTTSEIMELIKIYQGDECLVEFFNRFKDVKNTSTSPNSLMN